MEIGRYVETQSSNIFTVMINFDCFLTRFNGNCVLMDFVRTQYDLNNSVFISIIENLFEHCSRICISVPSQLIPQLIVGIMVGLVAYNDNN